MKTIFILIFLLFNVYAKDAINVPVAEEKTPQFIAISDVPLELASTLQELESIDKTLTASQEIKDLHLSLPAYILSVEKQLNDPIFDYLLDLDTKDIIKLRQGILVHKEQLKNSSNLFISAINTYDLELKKLVDLSNRWSQTHINADTKNAPETIIELITSMIIQIEEMRVIEKKHYDTLLIDSTSITNTLLEIEKTNSALTNAKDKLSGRFIQRNNAWIWSDFNSEFFLPIKYSTIIIKNLDENFNAIIIFYKTHTNGLFLLFILSLALGLFIYYFYYLYSHRNLFVKKSSFAKKDLFFLRRPISTYVLLTALLNVLIFPDRPAMVIQMTGFILIYPVIRIFTVMTDKSIHSLLYKFFIIYTFTIILSFSNGFDLTHRIFSLISTLLFTLLAYNFILKIQHTKLQLITNRVTLYVISYSVLILLIVSTLSNIIGYTQLSEYMTKNISMLLTITILMYLMTLILQGYILLIFRRRVTTLSERLRDFSSKMEFSILFFVRTFMFLWWAFFFFKVLNISDELILYKDSFLALSWDIGDMKLSIDSIVGFIIIMLLTWFSARSLQIILTFFVFARIKFSRGIATAIASISNYFVITIGSLMALASLGISTQQFILIFGALGVGIGFGLRNIIANFVSGIIMIFERPVQIGDTISVDNMMGDVTKIGSRSSTIRTFDGSEVIIPNADFISQKIVNWTFSDKERRKTFLIKVAIGTEVQKVIDIMMQVARNHPDVLQEPEPIPTLLSVGEYYLEFKLYFWLSENLIVAQSDIAIGIYNALVEAGVKMPATKQEVLLEKE